jgi:hypothetical protein
MRDIDGGISEGDYTIGASTITVASVNLAADILEGNTLSYLQRIEESEAGLIFIRKDGVFAFRQRLTNPVDDATIFSDSSEGIRYENVEITFGTELLANRTTVVSVAGTAIAENTASIAKYGVVERDFDLLLGSIEQLEAYGQYIVQRYGEPEYRVERITVNLARLSEEQVAEVLALEIASQADIIFSPNNEGQSIAIRNRIIGISHDVSLDAHRVSFAFEELPFSFFILDDEVFGRLDNTVGLLGF